MKRQKKSLNLPDLLKTLIKPNNNKPSAKKDKKSNHTPSWMYRNE